MRIKLILGVLAALLLLAFVIKQIGQAVHRTFQPPTGVAERDESTPAFQNGLTLLEIENVSPDRSYNYTDKGPQDGGGSSNSAPAADTGLWIKLPPQISIPATCMQSDDINCDNIISLTAHLSTGETIPLRWKNNSSLPNALVILLASLPAGYPDTVHWADVTVDDHHGGKATWRITHLPSMQHTIPPPQTAQTHFLQGSISAAAHAYRAPAPGQLTKEQSILCDITGTILNAKNDWEVGHMKLTREWEPPNFAARDSGNTYGAGKVKGKVTFGIAQQPVYFDQPQPYLNAIHWVRLDAILQEFATYDEPVTFHNLTLVKSQAGGRYLAGSQSETVTTPSGVTVTLVDGQHEKIPFQTFSSDGVGLLIRYPNTRKLASLPHSPLWRKHPGLVSVSVEFPPSYSANGSSYGDTEGTYSFRPTKPLPKVIPNFPVIIRQRVDLRTVPMSFTLPVDKK